MDSYLHAAPDQQQQHAKRQDRQAQSSAAVPLKDNRPQAVAQKKQAEALATGKYSGKPIQGYFITGADGIFMMAQEKRKTEKGESFLRKDSDEANVVISSKGNLRISNDKQMAVEDGGGQRQAKMFYATKSVIDAANQTLAKIGSPMRLATHPGISITAGGEENTLNLAFPVDLQAKKVGDKVTVPQRCNEAAPYIGNTGDDAWLKPSFKPGHGLNVPQKPLRNSADIHLAAVLPLLLKKRNNDAMGYFAKKFWGTWTNDDLRELTMLQSADQNGLWDHMENLGREDDVEGEDAQLEHGTNKLAERYIKEFVNENGAEGIMQELGINQFIEPEVGDVLSIRSLGAARKDNGDDCVMDHQSGAEIKNPFPYHFATVIAKSGSDYITMENYARNGEEGDKNYGMGSEDSRYFFQMFGSLKQSFHSENKADYPNAMTLAFSPDRKKKEVEYDLDSPQVEGAVGEYNQKLSMMTQGLK